MHHRYFLVLFALTSMLFREVSAQSVPYDWVLRNGKIVDGTGNPWRLGDVAILGSRIAKISPKITEKGTKEIDATGWVIAPGFIDIHSHSDMLLIEDGSAKSKIYQGVTTEILGEGSSAGPNRVPPVSNQKSNDPSSGSIRYATLRSYYEALERSGIALNVASYVGFDNLWRSIVGNSFDRPSKAQWEEMKNLLKEAMEDGALGLSTMLAMPPGSLATTDDLVELCQVVKTYGGSFSTHHRNEGTEVLTAIREAIEIGERASIPVDIIHLKIADQLLWGKMGEIVTLIEQARKRGVQVQAHVYPYTRGNNNLSSIIPPWAHEGGTDELINRLRDGKTRERLKHEIQNGIPGWYNHYTAVGGDWSRMLISGKGVYEGLTMDRILALRTDQGKKQIDPLDALFDILIEHQGSVPTVYEHHTESDMNLALIQPWCSVGSDGSAYAIEGALRRGNPHPRNFGTFPRLLGRYVRERSLLTLEEAIRKSTSHNASKIQLKDRGLLIEGAFADIVIFSEEKVIDRSTYENPFQYSEGIEWVLVNGTLVLDRGALTGARPGKALRRSLP